MSEAATTTFAARDAVRDDQHECRLMVRGGIRLTPAGRSQRPADVAITFRVESLEREFGVGIHRSTPFSLESEGSALTQPTESTDLRSVGTDLLGVIRLGGRLGIVRDWSWTHSAS